MRNVGVFGLLLAAALPVWSCSSSTEPENLPPSIIIASPTQGTVVPRGDTVRIAVSAADLDGSVTRVELYVDDGATAVDSTSPYELTWITREADIGNHRLRLVATDDQGWTADRHLRLVVRWADVAPETLDDGWQTATPGSRRIDPDLLADMMDRASGDGYEFLHALLIVRNGKLVFDEYFNGFTRDSMQHVQSTTKSFTSAVVGIAIDRGEIGSVHDPLFDYLPQYAGLNDEHKAKITVQHCLMMAAGLEWNETTVPTLDPNNDNIVGHRVPDYVAYMLAKPVVAAPGTVWYYNSGCPLTMGVILQNTTGLAADIYAQQHLFAPLGVTQFWWPRVNGWKHVGTHGSLYVLPRDMAKFGQLFLQRGRWEGERVISEAWVAESTQPRLTVGGTVRYGYQWWFNRMAGYDVTYTSGYGGQHIYIVPELDMVPTTATARVCRHNGRRSRTWSAKRSCRQ
jgi:CubicO group peptidase (beta-lactamase class C family)